MKALIIFKSGAQVEIDVTEFSTGRSRLSGDLESFNWTTPADYKRKLHTLTLSEVAAVVTIAEGDES